MNNWIESLNATSAGWADRFWIATWQAIIVIAIAWLLTLLLHRLSPRVRSWIWRLAYVKILLSLFWTTPIELALLSPAANPQNQSASRERQRPEEREIANQASGVRNHEFEVKNSQRDEALTPKHDDLATSSTPFAEPQSVSPDAVDRGMPSGAEPNSSIPAAHGGMHAAFNWQSYLLIAWLLGLIAVIAWLAADAWRAAKLLRSSRPLTDNRWRALSEDVCHRLGLRRAIRLRSSPTARGPVLIRFLRPAIILPQSMVDSSPETASCDAQRSRLVPRDETPLAEREGYTAHESFSDLALAIAHEAAHLRRHDLAWNALAAVVQVALYFHPLVWLAHRRIRLEQELACDELVLEKLAAAPQDYGRMLVNVVRRLSPAALAVAIVCHTFACNFVIASACAPTGQPRSAQGKCRGEAANVALGGGDDQTSQAPTGRDNDAHRRIARSINPYFAPLGLLDGLNLSRTQGGTRGVAASLALG